MVKNAITYNILQKCSTNSMCTTGLSTNMYFQLHKKLVYCLNSIDPRDGPSNVRYFPRNSSNSLKVSPKFRANIHIQSLTQANLFFKTKSFLSRLRGHFIGFNLIYLTLLEVTSFWTILFWKNEENMENWPFFWAAKAGLGKQRMGSYGRIGA